MANRFHDTAEWRELRDLVKERDDHTCLFHRFGDCQGLLEAHHIDPVAEARGDALDPDRIVTVCKRHHPILEAVVRRSTRWKVCTHVHRYPGAKAECERRLNAVA